MAPKLLHLIFDVSGTLWDDLDQVFEANLSVLTNNGYNTCPSSFTNGEYIGKPLTLDALKANGVGSCVEQFRRFEMEGTDEYLTKLYIDELDVTSEKHPVKLYDGIEELLSKLDEKGVGMSVVSSHPQHRLDVDFERLSIDRYFSDILGSTHDKKSDIRVHTRNGLKKLDKAQTIPPFYNVAYIGDTISDIRAANDAQVKAIGVSYGYQSKQKLLRGNPEIVCESVKDLSDFLINS